MALHDEPDFDRLALESPYSRDEWRRAWAATSPVTLWPTVLEMVLKVGTSPTAAAQGLSGAFLRDLAKAKP